MAAQIDMFDELELQDLRDFVREIQECSDMPEVAALTRHLLNVWPHLIAISAPRQITGAL